MIWLRKYVKHRRVINIILLFLLLLVTYNQSYSNLNNLQLIIFFILWVLLITNDVLRNIKNGAKKWYYFSLALSIILAAILKYLTNDLAINYYYFYIIIEILYIENKNKRFFLLLHFILFLVILGIETLNVPVKLPEIETDILVYFSVVYMLYVTYSIHIEKEETKKLNEKLKSSNIKLHEYSQQVEELSIARERERVAQELHDSLGHSLMALTMHLDFAEKTFDTNPEKIKEVIVKTRDIAKSSTSKLRKAVTTLKDERNIESLRNSINELIDNFSALSNIKIDLIMNKDLEILNPDLKLCIYKTIRESLTNGIKHGMATEFKLELFIKKGIIILKIKDNGVGCDKITMSNGLKGIEERIIALGGFVDFTSLKNNGFLIKAKIPIYQEI